MSIPTESLPSGAQRILVINPIWPHSSHSVRAANVVIYELMAELARQPDVKVGFLKVDGANSEPRTDLEEEGIRALRSLGVEFLEPMVLPAAPARRSKLGFWLRPQEVDFYPEVPQRAAAVPAAMAFRPDLIFIPWSETTTSLFADVPVKKFAYYGNPDPKSGLARADFARNNGGSLVNYLLERLALARMERFHLRTMRHYDYLGDVAANDADYYRRHGHPNAFYIRNLWIDRLGTGWRAIRDNERTDPFVIIGSLGKLSATANTMGLDILGRELMPELRRAMAERNFEVQVLGAGNLHPAVKDALTAPDIRLRGFVDDIDQELTTAPVFLCLNNASSFKVGHTRYLHAWSLGSCVVAHRDAALSMPEMISGENCLLGESMSQVADLIAQAAADPGLRRRLGENGYATFRDKFRAKPVVEQIMAHVRAVR